MQQKFKFFCNRYYSERVAFDAPEGFEKLHFNELSGNGITFFSNNLSIFINVYYGNEALRIFDNKGCVKIGENFKVTRGNFECEAFYFNYEKRKARFYFERYAFKPDKHGYSRVNVVLWVFDENDEYAAEKVLQQPKIKDFFDSIEYF